MRDLFILLIHLLTTIVKLMGPGGVRSVAAESILIKQQLIILNRARALPLLFIHLLALRRPSASIHDATRRLVGTLPLFPAPAVGLASFQAHPSPAEDPCKLD